LHPSRRNARFPGLGATLAPHLLDARQASGVTTFCDDKKGEADAAKVRANTMRPRGKLSKASLARAAERLRHSNPVNHFGFQLVKAERGRAVFRMPVLELHKQIHRVVHGGVLAMLADTAGGFAAFLAAPTGSRVVTIEMKINFLEPVEDGEIEADARVLRQGRTTSVVDCDVTDQDGRLVSKALMTFSILPPNIHPYDRLQPVWLQDFDPEQKRQAEACPTSLNRFN
jgi:uncharacterized protein (TIGR00369 family)